ncbi:hypothetical protein AAMO2058_001337300 [Amorphochlora amoebiformis]
MGARKDLPYENQAEIEPPEKHVPPKIKQKKKSSNKSRIRRDEMSPPNLEEVQKRLEKLELISENQDLNDTLEVSTYLGSRIEEEYEEWNRRVPEWEADTPDPESE